MRNFENKSKFNAETLTPPSEERIEDLLNDLRKVGPEKPLGYLPLSTLIEICHIDPKTMQEELEKKGLKVMILKYGETNVIGGALFAFDEEALRRFLEEGAAILKKAGWPTNPESFVRHLRMPAGPKTDLFDLIADVFGDKINPGRRQVQYKKGFSQLILLIVAGVIVAVAGVYFALNRETAPPVSIPAPAPSPSPLPAPTPGPAPAPIACTQEAKQCTDGTYVGRTGPDCEFAECPAINPLPVTECKKDSDCSSSQYICQATQGMGTACPDNDKSCVPSYIVIKGECKLKEGNRCSTDSDCAAGNLCNKNICTSPAGRQCNSVSDTSCPVDFECVQGCGPPVARENDPPPTYFCQLKGYVRMCPICLSVNTLIDTPLGAFPIQQLRKGVPVWTTNKYGERVVGVVIKISRVPVLLNHLMVELILDDERKLLVSSGHPTADGRTVGNLAVGDTYDGARVVSSGRVLYGYSATYDILPSGDTGFYWANSILLDSTLH